jgi:hypothetical protein
LAVPNPADAQVTVFAGWTQSAEARIEILDLTGSLVYFRDLGVLAPGTLSAQIDVSRLASGIYWIAVKTMGSRPRLVGIFKLAVVH